MSLAPAAGSPRRRPRLGLSTKLYLAIGGAVALTLAASVVAWISFVELGQVQRRITHEHIPSIANSLRLARADRAGRRHHAGPGRGRGRRAAAPHHDGACAPSRRSSPG